MFSLTLLLTQSTIHALVGYLQALFAGRPARSAAATLFIRNVFNNASQAHIRSLYPPTETTIEQFAAKQSGLSQGCAVTVASQSKGFWFGRKCAPRIIVYFHGGGYTCPISRTHLKWLFGLRQCLSQDGVETSVVMLSYDVVPEAQYPRQLEQAVGLLEQLIHVEKISPSRIFLGGDSAGGNLTIGTMLHVLRPNPVLPELNLECPFRGVFLISPWITFDYTSPMVQEADWDMLTPSALNSAQHMFLGSASRDFYNEPLRAPSSLWSTLNKATNSIFFWYGNDELLKPSVEKLSSALAAFVDVTVYDEHQGTHIGLLVDYALRSRHSKGDEALHNWFRQHDAMG